MKSGIDFRDLILFNDSLLDKQTWRLLHNTDSLFYCIFKSYFFPNCSIMEAKDSISGSYAWRSLLRLGMLNSKGHVGRLEMVG